MGQKVLVIDDEMGPETRYREILESDGFDVRVAQSGEQAVNLVNGYRPDMVLLDIMRPGKDGVEVARELSRRPGMKQIPIVLITALRSLPSDNGRSRVPEIRRFIYKPCRPKTLLEGVNDALRYRH